MSHGPAYALLIALASLVFVWLVFVVALYFTRPDKSTISDTARLLPDTVRLVRRLAGDRTIRFTTRLPVWLLLGYLIFPIDLIPDFLPVIGYADDAIVTVLVLRWFVRHVGPDKLGEHWPGSPDGLTRVRRLLRIADSSGATL
jgi:uncharacterized membrane protein YkvA (DUF1232 family)